MLALKRKGLTATMGKEPTVTMTWFEKLNEVQGGSVSFIMVSKETVGYFGQVVPSDMALTTSESSFMFSNLRYEVDRSGIAGRISKSVLRRAIHAHTCVRLFLAATIFFSAF